MKFTQSIRFRLMSIIALLVVGTLFIVSGSGYYISEKYLKESLDQTQQATAASGAAHVKVELEKDVLQLEDLSTIARVQSGVKENIVPALKEVHERMGSLDHLFYASLDGKAVNEENAAGEYADREYFQKVVNTKKPYVSEVLISRTTNKQTVVLAVPVIVKGQLTGVIFGTYSLDKIMPIVEDIKFKTEGYGVLLSRQGLYLADGRHPEFIGKVNLSTGEIKEDLKNTLGGKNLDSRLTTAFQQATSENSRVPVSYASLDGVERVGSISPIELPGGQVWYLLMTTSQADATSEVSSLSHILLGLSLLCLIIVLGLVFWLSNSFVRPILRINELLKETAAGNLHEIKKTITDKSEFGQLSDNMMLMNKNLRALVQQVHAQAEQLAASSEELTASAQQSADASNQIAGSITEVAHGAERQSKSADNIAGISQRMARKVEQISSKSNEASVIADSTSKSAQAGLAAVNKTVEQINEIGRGTEDTAAAINELSGSSEEIREIISLISAISGQTNLLALNAAIEAARAGEHGRGFAVVAEEVRKLAEESNQAAQKIGSLVEKNEVNLKQVIAITQAGKENMESGISLVRGTGESFRSIADGVLELSGEIQNISQSIKDIADGNKTLVSAIDEIDVASKSAAAESENVSAATQEQSASMEEIASGSHHLAVLAMELQEAIAKFKL